MGSVLAMLMSKGGGASIVASIAVSSMMTVAVAVPMGVTALEAANETPSSEEAIVTTDERFPDYVDLSTSELAALIEPTAEVEPEPDPSSVPSATATPEPPEDAEELAIVLPTATPTLAPLPTSTPVPPTPIPTVDAAPPATARPAPTPPPQPRPTPRPERPTSQPDPTAEPRPTEAPPREAPTTVPVATPTSEPTSVPTAEPELPMPATDVYAYIAAEGILVEDEVATVLVKAVNVGPASTTDVVLTVNVQGGTVTGVTPDPFGWSCSGGGSSWVCSGPFLESRDVGRNIVNLVPDGDTVVVEVSVSHQAPDDQPGNDVTTSTLEVIDG